MIEVEYRGSPEFSPGYQTLFSAGCDVVANITEHVIIKPGECRIIPTGVFIKNVVYIAKMLPCLWLLPRSSLAARGLMVANSPGLIDADYRDEIKVVLINLSDIMVGVAPGQRIAQLVGGHVWSIPGMPIRQVERQGGLGSTDGAEITDRVY